MARLIPSFMDDRTPPGERDVFNMLAAGPEDWVALHSLDLSPWNRGLRTEIDFVVIVPDTGILCIEVKSHENITFVDDRWHPPDIKRSPFKQASDARHTFYRRLREIAPQFKCIPVIHCCIFPRALFDLPTNLSVQPWELMDMRTMRTFRTGEGFCMALRTQMQRSIQADKNLATLATQLTPKQIEEIVFRCVPVQRRRTEAREEVVRREEQAARMLREQQKPVLQLATLNDRIIVHGGAGTGKTLIAIEVARRAAEKGLRVALLCFNQLIGDWMRQHTPQMPNLIVGRAIQVMAEMVGVDIDKKPSSQFWETELPQLLEERLTNPDLKSVASFDYLIIDEAQDIFARPRLWQCLTQFISSGIDRGAFAVFGDFDNQILHERAVMNETLRLFNYVSNPARWRLSENCRNYRIIGDTALRFGGFENDVYSGYMRVGGTLQNYDIAFYEHENVQLDQVASWLNEFKAQGYKPSEVSILSFRSLNSCLAATMQRQGFRLRPMWQGGDCTGYTSVHAFKGMENKVIILTDLVLSEADFHRHLFYTGMTRATESVRVACDIGSKTTLQEWLTKRN